MNNNSTISPRFNIDIEKYKDWGVVLGIVLTVPKHSDDVLFEWSVGLTYDLFID